jgi:ribosome-associated protein
MDSKQREEQPSRSARKRAAKSVEETARQLVELPESEVRKLPAADDLMIEIRQTRSTRGLAARQRQVKFLAGMLRKREDDLARLRDFLDGVDQIQQQERQLFHSLEVLRDRLCNPDSFHQALQDAGQAFPGLDHAELSSLAIKMHATGDRRFSREIFQLLRQAAKKPSTP